jgi:acetoin utilization deacetylase AcuC-like enzyme
MKTVFSPRHAGHSGQTEIVAGRIVPGFESPRRADIIHKRVLEVGLGPVLEPDGHTLDTAHKVHDPDYLDFLQEAWPRWVADGNSGPAMPYAWPTRGLRGDVAPTNIEGLLGFYSFDGGASFVEGTWDAVKSSHDTALTAAGLVAGGERAAFALCRPPGHHAGSRFAGGYCYINNASVAAQWLRDNGAARMTILDIDYHHGNGTQEIFYARADVQVINLHCDPRAEYPFFLGNADECGAGSGDGCNHNFPMPVGTGWEEWSAALDEASKRIAAYQPEVVLVSLGVDTFERDPISQFRLKSEHYPLIGARIAALALPTLFVMEGGYAVDEIGVNVVGVLTGFADG